ncbi:hypothetical protein [Streptomyces sp. NPDC005181]|uniref:hypothetical protein n=1 Tax=Streptomyces sp. NPDC005181 TaxID=3156869 RepID=UPI0033B4B634
MPAVHYPHAAAAGRNRDLLERAEHIVELACDLRIPYLGQSPAELAPAHPGSP